MCAMTGRPCAPCGAQTLMNRQSSLPAFGPDFPMAGCVQMLPKAVAASVALHGACGCGGAQRRLPTGGAAYGMPSHSLTPLTTMPHTGPVDVCTTGVLGSQGTAAAEPFDVATTSAAVASIAPPSRACRKIDLIIASSSSRCNQRPY